VVLVFSPKGWEFSAQGNALGGRRSQPKSAQPEGLGQVALSQPFRLQTYQHRLPRAAPWAEDCHPFGVKTRLTDKPIEDFDAA
jgi:hypothetical protein